MTEKEIIDLLKSLSQQAQYDILSQVYDVEFDNEGQVVVYTGIYSDEHNESEE